MEAELSRQHLKVLRKTTEAATMFTLRSSPKQFFLWARAHIQQTAVKMNLTIAANAYPFKLNSNAANNISASAPIWGGNTSSGVASGDAISRNTRSIFIRLNT